jgi:hypothetical protein
MGVVVRARRHAGQARWQVGHSRATGYRPHGPQLLDVASRNVALDGVAGHERRAAVAEPVRQTAPASGARRVGKLDDACGEAGRTEVVDRCRAIGVSVQWSLWSLWSPWSPCSL